MQDLSAKEQQRARRASLGGRPRAPGPGCLHGLPSAGALTSADWPVVTPGCKHVAHFHAGDPLGPLQVIAFVAGELDAGS